MIATAIVKLPLAFSIKVESKEELVFLAIQSIILLSDFCLTAVYEQASSVPGFAPSLKDIPTNKLVWEGWNSDISAITCQYKCKNKPGKLFILSCISMDPHVTLVSFSDKTDGSSFSIEVDPAMFINENILSMQNMPLQFTGGNVPTKEFIDSLFIEQDQLNEKITDLISKLVTPVAKAMIRQDSPSTSSSNYISSTTTSFVPVVDNRSRNPDVLMPPVIGDGDLNPFPQLIPPVPQPSYGSGSLVGPNHPIFGNQPMNIGPQGPYIPGLPQPRFDPFYPHVPGEIGPGIAGGRGGRGGRGRMRPQPGEPNPDHFSPPGFNEDDFI